MPRENALKIRDCDLQITVLEKSVFMIWKFNCIIFAFSMFDLQCCRTLEEEHHRDYRYVDQDWGEVPRQDPHRRVTYRWVKLYRRGQL